MSGPLLDLTLEDSHAALAQMKALALFSEDIARICNKLSPAEDATGCLLWTGFCSKDGQCFVSKDGQPTTVARFVYELLRDPIPTGHYVSQTCGNRRCALPAHLKLQAPRTLSDRLAAKSTIEPATGCRLWTGTPNGSFRVGKRTRQVWHVAWEVHHHKEFPDNSEIRTTCGNRLCIAGDHLEVVPRHSQFIASGEAFKLQPGSTLGQDTQFKPGERRGHRFAPGHSHGQATRFQPGHTRGHRFQPGHTYGRGRKGQTD